MADISVKVEGLANVEAALRNLSEDVAKNAIRRGVAAGARVIRDKARAKVHNISGDLARSISVSTRVDRNKQSVTAKVRPSKTQSHIARFVEFGTLPHHISPAGGAVAARRMNRENRRALKLGKAGPYLEGVDHPGARPKPFMAPAAEEGFPAAVQAVVDSVTESVRKATKA